MKGYNLLLVALLFLSTSLAEDRIEAQPEDENDFDDRMRRLSPKGRFAGLEFKLESTKVPSLKSASYKDIFKSTKGPSIKSTKVPSIKSTKAPSIKSSSGKGGSSYSSSSLKSTKAPSLKSTRAPTSLLKSTKVPSLKSTKVPTTPTIKAAIGVPTIKYASSKAPSGVRKLKEDEDAEIEDYNEHSES